MPTMEQNIQPFQGDSVGPTPYVPPGGEPSVPAIVSIGLTGGTQTFNGDLSFTRSTKVGAVHSEASSGSETIQGVIADPQGS